jgi:CRISPR/Cas system CSM-associated protein Csm3 (group 7 of RAMP superfamily)
MKGKDRGLFHIRLPDGRLIAKEYHNSDLEVRPIDVMNGIIHVREKGVVPALEVFDTEFEAADAEKEVKKRVTAPARDTGFEEMQRSFEEAKKRFMEERMQPDTSERHEEAVDRVIVNGSEPGDEPAPAKAPLREVKGPHGGKRYMLGGKLIKKADFDRLLQEERDARR